jgi:NADPH-dependent curcumin reductase CurA
LHRPKVSSLRRHRPGGVIRSDNLHFGKGEWVMSLAGNQRYSFVFRKEQMLKVD